MSETQKASPSVESGDAEKRVSLTRGELIHTLYRYEKEVKDVVDFKPFLDSVMNGEGGVIEFDPKAKAGQRFGSSGELDPNSAYRCDFCNHLVKGREMRRLESGHYICDWCYSAEVNFGVIPKEGDNVTTKE